MGVRNGVGFPAWVIRIRSHPHVSSTVNLKGRSWLGSTQHPKNTRRPIYRKAIPYFPLAPHP